MTSVLKSLIRNKKVGVFIDSANLYYAANKASLKIDYFQIARWFKSNCELTSLNFYTAFDPLDERQNDFFNDLEKTGYTLIKKPIRVFADSVKGNMDIDLAVDVLMNQDKFEVLILISGDGDFQRLIQALEQLKKRSVILGVGGFTSYDLHQQADNYFFLNRIQEVWKKPRQRSASKNVSLPLKLDKGDGKNEESVAASKTSSTKSVTKPKSSYSTKQTAGKTKSTTTPKSKQTKYEKPLPRVKVKIDPDSKPKIILE